MYCSSVHLVLLKYEALRMKDKVLHRNLCKIIQEMQRNNPAEGIGKPEMLRQNLSGMWSRRLSQKDRVIYTITENSIHLLAIGGHYDERP